MASHKEIIDTLLQSLSLRASDMGDSITAMHLASMQQHVDEMQADLAALKAYARAVEALCDQHGCEAWEIGMELQRHPRAAALLDQEEDG